MAYEFDAVIIKVEGGGAYVEFPYDVEKEFGTKGRVPVRATFDGIGYRGLLVRMGAPCHIIGIRSEVQRRIGKGPGDTVRVTIEKDDEPRTVEVPPDLEEALDGDPEAKEIFERMSYSHKREYVEAILEAKRPQTRAKRIERTIEMLKDK
jgi:hypothetical protein